MTKTTNKFFKLMGINSPDEFREHCINDQPNQYVKQLFGMEIPDLYEQAEEAITLYFQNNGIPRNFCHELAQELLFHMAAARVDGVHVGISTVLAAAGLRPRDFMDQVELSLANGEVPLTRLEQ